MLALGLLFAYFMLRGYFKIYLVSGRDMDGLGSADGKADSVIYLDRLGRRWAADE